MASKLHTNLIAKLNELADQFRDLSSKLIDPAVLADHHEVRRLSIRRKALEPIVNAYTQQQQCEQQLAELREIQSGGDDPELAELAKQEIPELAERSGALIETIQRLLVNADDETVGSVIVEVRAGVGGDEAALWAGDLTQMYERYASLRKWSVEQLDYSGGDHGGAKQAILRIIGEQVWTALGQEAGTHQVKRVPATEAQGRIHTSTATVAVLPEPEEIELSIDKADVKEMITTAQGPGGQNVNKVATAVHLIHEPTGVEVRMQDTKSQAQNREKAWVLLRARLYERQRAEAEAERAEARSEMIGTAGRAEKIRTYRYKDNLVVDHRLGESFNLGETIAGNMQPLIDALIEHETARRLAAL